MSAKESRPGSDVDIDPGWYPGQPELEDEPATAPEQLAKEADGAIKGHQVARLVAAGAAIVNPLGVPTVLTKLQKWGDYESVGAQVLPTKFIPMKTPLSAEILDSWSLPSQPKHRLTVPEMVAQQAALGRKVGLLLDLSNHDCLYSADIPTGLAYTHVQLVAKELPPPEFVDAVVAVANRFWAKHPDEYIAVHCAYGFNRTGFVLCCYLIECCGMSVEDALEAFAQCRPPGVKHEQFRMELHRRYSNGGPGGGNGTVGSPDDNSSFGYSPSCGSLDLRDMCCSGGGGTSPVPGLTRGSTFDCVLAPHHPTAMAAAAASGSGGGGVVNSPCVHRCSLDGHQTLTFTSSSFVQRASGGGVQRLPAPMASATALRPLQPLPAVPQSPDLQQHEAQQGEQEQQGERGERRSQGGQQQSRGEQESREQQQMQQEPGQPVQVRECADGGRGRHNNMSRGQTGACTERQDCGSEAESAAAEPAARVEAAVEGCNSSSRRAAAMMQRQPSCNDNESLGVNDRELLQTLRQQALAQLSATILEESGSARSTPARGCSSISLADCESSAGHSTPRPAQPGRYSHKSLDTIDWGAAAPAEPSGDVVGNGAGAPVPAFEAMRLG
ncbi:hypothetical protein PLESTB_000342300 [Pleodorina starrii]|uniref:Tyrosine specific protein phosphatases domain-containing protein n=1 Tax=Pleodorina starrii TaxID=330485 RepID=A0A9W6BDF2_9CHLO|nr:hypothetical protein PLESTM_000052300 [Pleodorina starrii]GLC50102.1 hypothetical protein PLESTB_000342300 [Pleodorina starrii]GLC73118.1 hypothetical protein PLESTF_001334100 [Pleodorina starrii]